MRDAVTAGAAGGRVSLGRGGGTEGNERIVGRRSRVLGPRSGPGSQGAAGGGSAASPFLAVLGERRCPHGVAAKSGDDRRGWGAAYDTGHWSRHSMRQRTHSPFITGLPRSGSLVTAERGHDSRGARGSGRREGHASAGLRAAPPQGRLAAPLAGASRARRVARPAPVSGGCGGQRRPRCVRRTRHQGPH